MITLLSKEIITLHCQFCKHFEKKFKKSIDSKTNTIYNVSIANTKEGGEK